MSDFTLYGLTEWPTVNTYYYTPFNGRPIAYTVDDTLQTHSLVGQPTLYTVGVTKLNTGELITLPYFPLKAHGQGFTSYEYKHLLFNNHYYAFDNLDQALKFARALMQQPNLGVLNADGTTEILSLPVLNNL